MEEKLRTLYDISGECILGMLHAHPSTRPRMSRKVCAALGYDWDIVRNQCRHGDAIIRFFFFEQNPEIDRNYSVVHSCGDTRCINVAHARLGLWNASREKYNPPI